MYSKYDEAQFHLRLTHELHAKIKQRAKMNNRSINAEIISNLEESFSPCNEISCYDVDSGIDEITNEFRKVISEILKDKR